MTSLVNRSRPNSVELESLVRHTMFQEHRNFGSEINFVIYGHDSHLDNVSKTLLNSLFPRGFHIKFGLDWPSGFEKSCLKIIIMHMYIVPGRGRKPPVVKVIYI